MSQEIPSPNNAEKLNLSVAEQLESLRFTIENLKQEHEDYSDAQFQKLKLEIDSLEQKNRWENRVGKWIPVLTAIIAVGGFLFGVLQFINSQKEAETARINAQAQIEANKSQKERDRQKELLDAENKAKQDEIVRAEQKEERERQRFLEDQRLEKEIAATQQVETERIAFDQRTATQQLINQQQLAARQQSLEQQKSINQLRHELNLANEGRIFERQKLYLEKQMTVYLQAAETAATIATSPDEKDRLEAEKQFWKLYFGSLAALEDVSFVDLKKETGQISNPIESAMVSFGQCSEVSKSRDDAQKSRINSSRDLNRGSFIACDTKELSKRALTLAQTIRQEIKRITNVANKTFEN